MNLTSNQKNSVIARISFIEMTKEYIGFLDGIFW
jgi:hypothetical protein